MGAAVTHVAKTSVFTPSGGSAWNHTDLQEISESEAGDVTELTTDVSQVVNGMFVDNIKGEITIVVTDLSQTTNAGAAIGSVGSLAIHYGKRAAGKGNVASSDLIMTYAAAILRSIGRHAGVTGHGTLTMTFGAYGTDGTTVKTASIG